MYSTYCLLNLDKGQFYRVSEILGCQVVDKIRHWNLEGPLNGGLIQLDGASIGKCDWAYLKEKPQNVIPNAFMEKHSY